MNGEYRLTADIYDLLSTSNRALAALAKSIVYQSFDAGDDAYHEVQDILMLRYGFECVAETWWAAEVAERVNLAHPGAVTVPPRSTEALPDGDPCGNPDLMGGAHVKDKG